MNIFGTGVCASSYHFDGPITSKDGKQLGDARLVEKGQCTATQLARQCYGRMEVVDGVVRRFLY